MRYKYCRLNLFLKICISIIAVSLQSNEGRKEPSLTECHWDPSASRSKSACVERCSRSFGFWDETTNKLICFNTVKPADMIGWTTNSCKCGYDGSGNRKYTSNLPCIPKMEFNITVGRFRCKILCGEIKLYTHISKRKAAVSYCDDSKKVVALPCQFIPDYYDEDLSYTHGYHCQCAVRSSLLLSVTDSTKEPAKEQTEESEKVELLTEQKTATMCQMGEFTRSGKVKCLYTCRETKGIILQNSADLVCYQRAVFAQVIPSDECQCGIITEYNSEVSVHACIPKTIHEIANTDPNECKRICKNTIAFVFGKSPNMRISRCEQRNYKPAKSFDKLKPLIGKRRKQLIDGKERIEYPCSCGVGSLLPLDLNMSSRKTRSSFPHLEYARVFQNNNSTPQNVTKISAEYSRSGSEKSGYVPVVDFDDCRDNGSEPSFSYYLQTIGNSSFTDYTNHFHYETISHNFGNEADAYKEIDKNEDFINLQENLFSIINNRNSSLEESAHSKKDIYIIPSPPPVAQETQSSLEKMINFGEWEEPVGDHVIPSISHIDMGIYDAVPFLTSQKNTSEYNYNSSIHGCPSQAPYIQDSQQIDNNFPRMPANVSLIPNLELYPSPNSHANIYLNNTVLSNTPQYLHTPSTNCIRESGSLESITNPNFKRGSSSNFSYNQDFRQMYNIPKTPANTSLISNPIDSLLSPNDRANNDLYDSLFFTTPRDFHPPLTHSSHRESECLESITNSNFISDSFPQSSYDQDHGQNDSYLHNNILSADDIAMISKVESQALPNDRACNDLFDVVFPTNQITLPPSFPRHSTFGNQGMKSVESVTKSYTNPSTIAIMGRPSPDWKSQQPKGKRFRHR